MKPVLLILAALPLISAHTTITQFFVNGVSQGDGYVCLRAPPVGQTTWPVQDLNSPDMACGLSGTTGSSVACSVPDGATLTFQYRVDPNDPSAGAIASSHVGSCAVYLKNVQNAVTDGAAGDGWFKIWDQGYDGANFCTTNLNNNDGYLAVTLPLGLKGGHYLVRTELLAIHNANQGVPQYYIECAQIFLESTGTLVPRDTDTVGMPGHVTYSDASDSFDIYDGTPFTNFKPPGPSLARLVNGGNAYEIAMKGGVAAKGCVLRMNDWCATEVPDYTDQSSCWASVKNCWAQDTECWAQPYSSLTIGCTIWQNKCTAMNSLCTAANPQGPPNKGRVLTPKPQTLIPLPQPLAQTAGLAGGQAATYTPSLTTKSPDATSTHAKALTSAAARKTTIITTLTTVTTSVYATERLEAVQAAPTIGEYATPATLSVAVAATHWAGGWFSYGRHRWPPRRENDRISMHS